MTQAERLAEIRRLYQLLNKAKLGTAEYERLADAIRVLADEFKAEEARG